MRWPAISVLLATLSSGLAAQTPIQTLSVNQPVQQTLPAGSTHVYRVTLAAGDFASGDVEQRGMTVQVRVLRPGGSLLRRFTGQPFSGTRAFAFVAPVAGEYSVELTSTTGCCP